MKESNNTTNTIAEERKKSVNLQDIDYTNKDVDFDELLSSAGEFGLYQVMLFCSTLPFYIFGVFVYFSQLFMTEVSPNHWCWIPELENLTDIERRTLAIPLDPDARFGYSQCISYVANWSEMLQTDQKPNATWSTQRCQFGWEFNKSEIPYPTISSELGWVCDKNNYQATAQSIFFVGSIVGGFVVGYVADRYGRLPAATLSNMIACVAGVISIYAQNLLQFSLCRFLMGMSYDNCMMMTYLLVLEYVAPKYRSLAANLPFAVFYTLGATALPWISLACGHWKIISLVTSLPMVITVLTPFLIPESPRWLLTRGRINDVVKKVVTIGRINKKEIPSKLIDQFKITNLNKEKENASIVNLFTRPKLRKLFVILCLQFMCCVAIFDTLIRSIGSLQFDFFLSFTLVSFTELPSLLIVAFVIDFTGRKYMSIFSLFACCIFCTATAFISNGLPSVLCAVVARFSINICVNICMQWTAEMLPTPLRGSGSSIVHICSYIGTILSPYIAYLEKFIIWLPLVVTALLAVIAILLSLALPETAGKELPQTFDEAEKLLDNQMLFDIPFLRKKEIIKAGNENLSYEMNQL